MNDATNLILASLAQGMQGIANKPQKVAQTTISKPIESSYIGSLRDQIGADRVNLATALRKRETPAYTLAAALAEAPSATSYTGAYGVELTNPLVSGLSAALRGFGTTRKARTDREIERAQTQYDTTLRDIAAALDASKAMGTEQTEYVNYGDVGNSASTGGNIDKITQNAYIKLDPSLPNRIRENPDAFGYLAREADIGARTPEGGATGTGERLVSSVAKALVGDKGLAKRGELLQQATQYVSAVTDLARQNGAAASMMNSDKEGQRALGILSNPANYTAQELAAAADSVIQLYDRMLAVAGQPSVEQGYQMVTDLVESRNPQLNSDPWEKYRQ